MRLVPVLFSLLTLAATTATAQEYKCQTGGKVYYAQYPCPGNEAKEPPATKTPVPTRRASDATPPASDGLANSTIVKQSNAMIAAALANGDFAKAERLAVTKEQWDMIAAAKRGARTDTSGAEARAQRNAQEAAKQEQQYQNEKELVHTSKGWDRKTRAELAAEEKRKAEARALGKVIEDNCRANSWGTINCN